jgi:hypothetical protein
LAAVVFYDLGVDIGVAADDLYLRRKLALDVALEPEAPDRLDVSGLNL